MIGSYCKRNISYVTTEDHINNVETGHVIIHDLRRHTITKVLYSHVTHYNIVLTNNTYILLIKFYTAVYITLHSADELTIYISHKHRG